ncbi:MAG TPA: helix-turn-helix domain-containing protein [Gemmatimonadaceae bacterium]|nr:helix-turn-helix domain-containing protein [Gemmatimonadaceae bacterium]
MDTRNVILSAAAQVFAQHGFRGSTTRRIADAAAVNEVTIFRYFGSKELLLEEAIKGSAGQSFPNPLPPKPIDPQKELTIWCSEVIEHIRSRRSLIRRCMGEMEERPQMTGCAAEAPVAASNELSNYFRTLEREGFTIESFDARAAAVMLMATLFHDAMGREMMPTVYPKPASKAPALYASLTLRAIGVRSPLPEAMVSEGVDDRGIKNNLTSDTV